MVRKPGTLRSNCFSDHSELVPPLVHKLLFSSRRIGMQYIMFLHDSPGSYGTYCLVLFIGNRTFTASDSEISRVI